MKIKLLQILLIAVFMTFLTAVPKVGAHCEVPCGIYDDTTRMTLIFEHITTIEKSMQMIKELSESGDNQNQLIRWVTNKEKHAEFLQDIVNQYFLTQRIKFDAEKYQEKLQALHQLLVYAMKCKQTVDLDNVAKIRAAATTFHELYFVNKEHKHQ